MGNPLTGVWKCRNNVNALLEIAEPTEQYLEQLLFSLTVDLGGKLDNSIVERFLENAGVNDSTFTADFKLETVLRTCMYWTFKASSELETADASSPLSAEGCLNLLKSHWIFHQFRKDPRTNNMAKEFQAILSFVSSVVPNSILPYRDSS